MTISAEGDASAIGDFLTFDNRLLVVKARSIHEVIMADQIDPDRINPSVPNAQRRVLRYGSDSAFVCRVLLTGSILSNESYLRAGVSRDRLMPTILDLTQKIAHCYEMLERYKESEQSAIKQLEKSLTSVKEHGSFIVPDIPNLDATCRDMFVNAKLAMNDLLALAAGFFGDGLRKRYFTNLEDYAMAKYGKDDQFYKYLKSNEGFREFIRITRNCIEHPKQSERVIVQGMRMSARGQIVLPTFELIHPKLSEGEASLGLVFESIVDGLIQFSEMLMVFMADKNTAKGRFPLEIGVAEFKEGYKGQTGIRFGYGAILNGQLAPVG